MTNLLGSKTLCRTAYSRTRHTRHRLKADKNFYELENLCLSEMIHGKEGKKIPKTDKQAKLVGKSTNFSKVGSAHIMIS